MIKPTVENRKILREHAKEALKDYSRVITWLVVSQEGKLSIISEPQGQTFYTGSDEVIDITGGFRKAHGDGAARDKNGQKYTSQMAFLIDLLGVIEYERLFNKKTKKLKVNPFFIVGHKTVDSENFECMGRSFSSLEAAADYCSDLKKSGTTDELYTIFKVSDGVMTQVLFECPGEKEV